MNFANTSLDYSMGDNTHSDNDLSLTARLESLLFVAPTEVTIAQLATALEVSTSKVEACLAELESQYATRGLRLQRHRGMVQITTAPGLASLIERFLGLESDGRLSRASLETLAIVAYEQPVTRPEIEAIRGVNSDGVLKNLLSKGLIQELGRVERPGRPILYGTTPFFLQHFGFSRLEDLPPIQVETREEIDQGLEDIRSGIDDPTIK